ncbi:Na/Pi cotransporter family protein [bacterium]|nr:Na/Pi cotransporter family protein [bacterium]
MQIDTQSLRRKLIGVGVLGIGLCLLWVTGIFAGLGRLKATVDFTPLLFSVVGGLGLFIFGVQIMSDSLQKVAGQRLRRILEFLTSSSIRGVMVGAALTAIIQSSSATTVMIVGFVNAGLMSLVQGMGVIYGAHIGTTITAQLIAFKITKYALPILAIGMAVSMSSKREHVKLWGRSVLGFGVLFYGLTTMVRGLEPLRESPEFPNFFVQFGKEPLLGILAGIILTVVVQSSSATVGLVIALGTSGLIDFKTAVPLMLGDNIGTTVTALLSSIGTSCDAKRAAVAHLVSNVLGVVWVVAVLSYFERFVDFVTPGEANSQAAIARHIANAHTMFNVANTAIQLPFIRLMARLVTWLLPDKKVVEERSLRGRFLQEQFLNLPPVAIGQIKKAILHMFERAHEMLSISRGMISTEDLSPKAEIMRLEDELDRHQAEITEYISMVINEGVSVADSEALTRLLHAVNDVENMGDAMESTSKLLERLKKLGQCLSAPAKADIVAMSDLVLSMTGESLLALREGSRPHANAALKKEEKIDEMKHSFRKRNRDRYVAFRRGESKIEEKLWGQVISNDIVSNMEKTADNIVNVLEAFELTDEYTASDIEEFS